LKNSRPLLINTTLVLFSLLLVGGLTEIILRLQGFNPLGEFFSDEGRAIFLQPSHNPQRIYEAKPGTSGYGWETEIRINSHGFRGREYSLQKPAGTFRIVVIGDSITFGNRLAPEENYPAVLESLYQQAGKSVEVLNLGLGGYDTLQEVATLKDIGLSFDPDLVILGYCINDIGIASGNVNYIRRLQQYGHWVYRSRLAQFLRIQLDRIELKQFAQQANRAESFDETYRDYLANIEGDGELDRLVKTLKKRLETENIQQPFVKDYTQESRLRRLRFAFEQLQQLQKLKSEKDFDVMVLAFPFLLEGNDQQAFDVIRQIVRHEAERLDFTTIDLHPFFSTAGFDSLMIKPDDGIHPNAQGHLIAAQLLFENISIHAP
jgi:lysophospholipase L1-like esterase